MKNTLLLLPLLLLCACAPSTPVPSSSSSTAPSPSLSQEPEAEPVPSRPVYDYVATTDLPEIDESTIQRILHVNPSHPAASSQGEGTADQPFSSIAAAHTALHRSLADGVPTKLLIAPGTYREDVRHLLNFTKVSSTVARETLLVIEGAAPGEVILSGSIENHPDIGDFRPATWKAVPGAPGLYVHDWPYPTHVDGGPWMDSYGYALLPGVMQRSEMVWVNGKHQRQLLSEQTRWDDPDGKRGFTDQGTGKGGDKNNQPGKLVFEKRLIRNPATEITEPGTFAVFTSAEVSDELSGKVFLRLPDGMSMDRVDKIEISHWKGQSYSPMLIIRDKTNLVIRNLTVRHGTMGPMTSAIQLNGCHNFIIEDCDISENVSSGIAFNDPSQGILRRVTANHNGGNGFGGSGKQLLFEDCETSFNNYRGGWAGWLAWHASGFKSGHSHNITVRRHTSIGNYANGIWYDVYCTNILVEDSLFFGNKRMGVMFELTKPNGGPHVLRNSIVAENDNTGVYLSMAANSRVEDCLIFRNGGGGNVESEPKNTQLLYKFRDHPQGPNSPEAWESITLTGNLFLSDLPDAKVIDYLDRNAEPLTQYDRVLTVLTSQNNRYGSSSTSESAFRLPNGNWTDFAGWTAVLEEKAAPGPDSGSTWNVTGLDPDRRRELTAASNSEISKRARAMGVPLPEDSIAEYWKRIDQGLYAPPYLNYEKQHD